MTEKRFNLQEVEKFLEITEEDKKETVILKQKGEVFYLVLNNGANTFDREFLRAINSKLDEVEEFDGPTALVTVGLTHKFYSTGMNLKFIMKLENRDLYYFVLELIALYGRLNAFPCPTIACVNGHAIAGGLMLAFSHEYVLMRNDFGTMAMTEIELGMPLPPGMMATVRNKTGNTKEFRQLVMTAKRFNADSAFQAGWIDQSCEPEKLFQNCVQLADSVAKFGENKENYKKLKDEMNKEVIDACFNKQHACGIKGEVPKL